MCTSPTPLARLPLAALLVWLAVGLVYSPPAAAHSELRSSTPEANARLGRLPASVRLTFNQDISERFARLRLVRGTDGRSWPLTTTVTGPTVTGRVPPAADAPASPGTEDRGQGGALSAPWTIDYRVVSADGHPIAGSVPFRARASPTTVADTDATSTPSAPSEPSPSADPMTSDAGTGPGAGSEVDGSARRQADDGSGATLATVVIAALTASVALAAAGWLMRARARASQEGR